MKFDKAICLLLALALTLCACQPSPKEHVITSKNDGSFDIGVVQNATEPQENWLSLDYDETFYSSDKSVEYIVNLQESYPRIAMPVLEVAPYFLSSEDAQRVAEVLFGDTPIYISKQRHNDVEFSKQEIQIKLQRWTQYANNSSVEALYGRAQENTVKIVQKYIEEYTSKLEDAPEDSANELCKWEFLKESCYSMSEEEIAEQGTSQDNDAIKAELDVGNIHYAYNVALRDKEDFKMSRISAYPYGGVSPDNIDEHIFKAILCRTDEPTDSQIDEVKQLAADMLEGMQLGEWEIDQCYLETLWYGETAEYIIHVTAVPVFEGVHAIRRPQLRSLQSEALYASNYYLTDVEFKFSANGDLVYFELNSPVQITSLINKNVATLDMETLIEKAKQHLSLRDVGEYGLSSEEIAADEDYFGEEINCKVNIVEMEYGLTRVKVPNSDDKYYYIPSLALYGTVEYCGEQSGTVYSSSGEYSSEDRLINLVCLNAIDGSIIELSNT